MSNKQGVFFINNKATNLLRYWQLYIMLIPFVLFYIIFLYKPLYGIQIAFKDYSIFKGIEASPWVGFKHFSTFFNSPYFMRTLVNTFLINLYGLVFGFPLPIILALLLNEVKNKYFKNSVQTAIYLPHFISTVVVAGIVTNFLAPTNGIVNIILEKLGGEKIYFLTKPEYFRTIFTSMNIWKEAGFGTIVYLSALAGIDQNLYEAAKIDGANRWKQTLHVTMPSLVPTIVILLILKMGSILKVGYEAIILLYQPVTYKTADVISTYVYRSGIADCQYDFATAVGIFNSVVSLILVWTANRLSKRMSETSLW
ncbi:ABC transporter permease [Vallitalea sp.]|uniref:ABC transporter permease n=1 Tax=Vallitalea sp. TaxID=1882829 RepID=UPI0025DBDC2B|nr:ABC transporter permease subunit [Vallitalea sp.]MCT4685796.1 ABC transporter permease subunit [Vallitalea sp.]